jgi:hypothetical protein
MKIARRKTTVKFRTMGSERYHMEGKKHKRKLSKRMLCNRETCRGMTAIQPTYRRNEQDKYVKLSFILDKCNLNL